MRPYRIAALIVVLGSLWGSAVLAAPAKQAANQPSTARASEQTAPKDAVPSRPDDGAPASIPVTTESIKIEPVPVKGTSEPAVPVTAGSAATGLKIDWLSINGGGETELSAGDIKMGVSIAQSVAGEVSAGNYKMGIGFWYGASGSGSACDCSFAGDIDASTAVDATDLQFLIDIVFFGVSDVQDPSCPSSRSDIDCSGFSDATDLQFLIDYIFFGGNPPCDACLGDAQASR